MSSYVIQSIEIDQKPYLKLRYKFDKITNGEVTLSYRMASDLNWLWMILSLLLGGWVIWTNILEYDRITFFRIFINLFLYFLFVYVFYVGFFRYFLYFKFRGISKIHKFTLVIRKGLYDKLEGPITISFCSMELSFDRSSEVVEDENFMYIEAAEIGTEQLYMPITEETPFFRVDEVPKNIEFKSDNVTETIMEDFELKAGTEYQFVLTINKITDQEEFS